MSDEASWYVLVEEENTTATSEEFRLRRVLHVEGDAERARERALEVAKEHNPFGEFKGTRSVFRTGENSFMTVMSANGSRKERFRVSVGELIHTVESVDESAERGDGKRRRGIFGKKG